VLFANISTDFVHLSDGNQEEKIHRNVIEYELGPKLVQWHKKSPFNEVCIINWPGGFTNLRAGCLCFNLLNQLLKGEIMFWSVDKLQIFEYFVAQKILPKYGTIYIGQKNNIWWYDFEAKHHQQIRKEHIPKEDHFADEVFNESYRTQKHIPIQFGWNKAGLELMFEWKNYVFAVKDLDIKPIDFLKPKYFVQPVISTPKKNPPWVPPLAQGT